VWCKFLQGFSIARQNLRSKLVGPKQRKVFRHSGAFCRRNLHSLLIHTYTHQGFISSGAPPVAATLDCSNEGALYVFELNAHKAEISSPQNHSRPESEKHLDIDFCSIEHTRRTRISAFYYISRHTHKQHSSPMLHIAACAWAQHATSSYS
jgi:hypothetical protein